MHFLVVFDFLVTAAIKSVVLATLVWNFAGNILAVACVPPDGAVFKDRTTELGLQLANSAACWADLDNDGWPEICAGGTVWRNNAGKNFSKLAEGLGEVVAADFDNDGFVDLFSWSTLRLFRNQHGEEFVPVKLPDLPRCVSLGACWGDFNGDGYVDLYVGGYEDWEAGITYPDLVLINDEGKALKLAWTDERFRARGVTACDFDRDGDLDVYVSNYRLQPNLLWVNDGQAKFTDGATKHNAVGTSDGFPGGHSIGSAWGDFDNDGLIDLFVGNFAHRDNRGDQPQSRFLRNLGEAQVLKLHKYKPEAQVLKLHKYKPEAQASEHLPGNAGLLNAFDDRGPCGVFYQESYASPSAGDYDNDGDLDLFLTTVYETASFGRKNNPVLYRNDGGFKFSDDTQVAKLADLPPTYQAAWADFDRDGDLDLVTAGKIFQNESARRHWLEVRVEGDGRAVNRSAIGAAIKLSLPDRTLTRQVESGTGQGNQNDLVLHFGLGEHDQRVMLEILWPSGVKQTVTDVAIDRVLSIPFEGRR